MVHRAAMVIVQSWTTAVAVSSVDSHGLEATLLVRVRVLVGIPNAQAAN